MPDESKYLEKLHENEAEGEFFENWYTRWCKAVNSSFKGWSLSMKKSREENRRRAFHEAERRFQKEEQAYEEAKKRLKSSDPRFRALENRYKREVDAYEKAKRAYERDEFRRELRFARFDIEPHEVIVFAYTMMLLTFLLFAVVAVFEVVPIKQINLNSDAYPDMDKNYDGINDFIETIEPQYEYHTDPETGREYASLKGYTGYVNYMKVFMFIIVPWLVLPIVVYIFFEDYPKNIARRLRVQTLGTMPEAVNYIVMSMHLSPSLDRAIDFAASNISEPMASNLKKLLWEVYMREHDSIEDAFVSFGYDWGEWNEDFKRSVYAIRSAVIERSQEGLHRTLQKANEIMLEGTKRQIEEFSAALATPTMTLFALGVLLPITLSAILPIAQIDMGFLPFVVLIMDIIFPLVTFGYAYHILGMRPGTSVPPKVPSPLTEAEKSTYAFISIIMALAFFALGALTLRAALNAHVLGMAENEWLTLLGSMPFMWGITLPLSFYLYMTTRDQKKVRDLTIQMEMEFPDALFQLGSRIAERKPIEESLSKVGETMKGTLIAWTFRKMAYTIQITRKSLKDVLFGHSGILEDSPSTTIKATMKTVIAAVRKEPVTAGQTIIGISNYLRDLKNVEHDIRIKLGQTIGMMMATATYFAPLIMGIVSSMYILLSQYLGGINLWGSGEPVSPIPGDIFSMIVEFYLMLTVMAIIYFCAGIRYGEDAIETRAMLAKTLPVATVIYSLSAIISKIYIGGW